MQAARKVDYYGVLELTKTATQQQIKQAYKKLALVHHPDKNDGAEHAKQKFREISEAYTVLNDPKKRDNYDKYGVADLDGADLADFEAFMESFGAFDDFLTEVLSFNDFEGMFSKIHKKSKRGTSKVRGGRAKGRNKGGSAKEMNELAEMLMGGGMNMDGDISVQMINALLGGGMVDHQLIEQMQKQLDKMALDSEDEDSDCESLTDEQKQILVFGEQNISKVKTGKKKKKVEIKCNLDSQKIGQDEILMHFSEHHMSEFKKWQTLHPTVKQEQQIQY